MPEIKFIHSSANPDAPVAYCSFTAMHTVIEVLFEHADEPVSREICGAIRDLVNDLEGKLSRHIATSDISRLNASAGAVPLCEELYFSLELCEQFRSATKGYFDIAALSASRHRPAYETLPAGHKARRCSKDIRLDLGGYAKGFALEKVKGLLSGTYGVQNALINFGNSSVSGLGHHPLGDCWLVSPARKESEHTFRLADSALSVSGKTAGVREHIIDPETGSLASKEKDIAVLGQSALVCEILSTALYAAPQEKWPAVLQNFAAYKVVEL